MKNYVGIDLGTTNSAICSFNGEALRIYKSPEQHDVTPSAIFIDKRGNKYVGKRAYDNAARNPDNAATLFKRLMGTSTPIKLTAVGQTFSPEQCSAEILKALFGYLPEEVRNDEETGTVITVPAAFNQMQKDATMSAAELAGLGKVALMQEPVAAVMSVMRQRKGDGVFLVFDLGGGTLDIAIAESIAGRVSLLSHGGVAMCGGRDFDRALLDNVVKPWLMSKFNLPPDLTVNGQYKPLIHTATWAAEKAKIELSGKEEAVISTSESELGTKDSAGAEMYLDIPLTRKALDELIAPKVDEAIQSAREAMEKVGLKPQDIERIVFVGGPTQYKPLRDRVSFELGIAPSTDVDPMTAVAEGASVFAEAIDWTSQNRNRKANRGSISAGGQLNLAFNFIARTPDAKAKIVVKATGVAAGVEFQVDSPDTGWSSGRIQLKDGAALDLSLTKMGDNQFKIWVFDPAGGPIKIQNDRITITRTAATIDAIPASSSIGIEVLEKIGGQPVLEYLVREGDPLPKKGKLKLKAGVAVRAQSGTSLVFKLWEGEVQSPITHNRFIGDLRIKGTDFDEGQIGVGADLECDYEALDSGNIVLEVSVPSIGGRFHSGRNFYSRQEGGVDFTNATQLIHDQAEEVREKLQAVAEKVNNEKIDQALARLEKAEKVEGQPEPEVAKQAMDDVLEARKLLAQIRKEHLKELRQLDLDVCVQFFTEHVREHARPAEATSFDNLARTAQRAIEHASADFDGHLDQLRGKNFEILWRQDWFVVNRFKQLAESSHLFPNSRQHAELVVAGVEAVKADDMQRLRQVTGEMMSLKIGTTTESDMLAATNVIKG